MCSRIRRKRPLAATGRGQWRVVCHTRAASVYNPQDGHWRCCLARLRLGRPRPGVGPQSGWRAALACPSSARPGPGAGAKWAPAFAAASIPAGHGSARPGAQACAGPGKANATRLPGPGARRRALTKSRRGGAPGRFPPPKIEVNRVNRDPDPAPIPGQLWTGTGRGVYPHPGGASGI